MTDDITRELFKHLESIQNNEELRDTFIRWAEDCEDMSPIDAFVVAMVFINWLVDTVPIEGTDITAREAMIKWLQYNKNAAEEDVRH